MTKSLDKIAKQLRDSDKKVNLIYAFNGSGKTRLSKVFKNLIAPKENHDNEEDLTRRKILYFNAFTEDLFYWDNDLLNDTEPKLKIQPNSFIRWLIRDQGDEGKVIGKFHHYCDEKLMPKFDIENNQITFSFARGDDTPEENIKLSKGEESNFIWSIFHTLIEQVVAELNISEPSERTTNEFDELKYIFIDDPVSSLDENHLIQLAVDLAELVKDSPDTIKFIITTHNPLFYNVLYNELGAKNGYILRKDENKNENERFDLEVKQGGSNKSFSYHLFLKNLLEEVKSKDIQKYHFMLLRNLYEKTANFLGYSGWSNLLPNDDARQSYYTRIINFTSHSTLSNEIIAEPTDAEKKIVKHLINNYGFYIEENIKEPQTDNITE
ncbi:AAA family ATPase [Haemophilus influenzae]|uniref:Anticodon nuclease n=1 Tax=Haemophilus influenzae TaxID=727 RepID=A0A3E1QG78_HAEIF|nr:AAA family ATPase [Haemophilus influenzae]AXP39667.1 anticodon nuclease [Haemophilus influenzae]RFN63069.1 anticodon nuclease [Haemophilus influenzae]RFO13135.1 anticodon nuclease [Haemophilus influenzae]